MSEIEVAQRLADALGIKWRGEEVTGFDVRVRSGGPPRVVVHYWGSESKGFDLREFPAESRRTLDDSLQFTHWEGGGKRGLCVQPD